MKNKIRFNTIDCHTKIIVQLQTIYFLSSDVVNKCQRSKGDLVKLLITWPMGSFCPEGAGGGAFIE